MAASYGAPGVYIEEVASGSMPIEGVAALVEFMKEFERVHA